jgi:hypothetical protein
VNRSGAGRIVALLRYLAADALRAQRWVAPLATYFVVCATGTTVGGNALGCYALSAAFLLPVAIWVTAAVVGSEDPVQTAITVVTAGGTLVVTLAKLAVALLVTVGLALVALVWPLVTGHPATAADVASGLGAHLTVAVAGVAVGAVLARPLVPRPAWAVVGGLAVCLVEIAVPHAPPVRPIAELLTDAPGTTAHLARELAVVAAQTAVLATVLVTAVHLLGRRRA